MCNRFTITGASTRHSLLLLFVSLAVPNLSAFGNTSLKITMGMAAVIPIILNCYVGHQSIHGIMTMLKPYSVKEMKAVCGGSLAMGCVIFLVLGLGSVAAFGAGVDANILNNLSATGMAPLIGSQLASVSGSEAKFALVCWIGSRMLILCALCCGNFMLLSLFCMLRCAH